jgi:hypothetical protein
MLAASRTQASMPPKHQRLPADSRLMRLKQLHAHLRRAKPPPVASAAAGGEESEPPAAPLAVEFADVAAASFRLRGPPQGSRFVASEIEAPNMLAIPV